ncbi:hypothetical protein D3C84_801610 [compost metagenome]
MAPLAMVAAVAANIIWNSRKVKSQGSPWCGAKWLMPYQPVTLAPNIRPKPTSQKTMPPTQPSM